MHKSRAKRIATKRRKKKAQQTKFKVLRQAPPKRGLRANKGSW